MIEARTILPRASKPMSVRVESKFFIMEVHFKTAALAQRILELSKLSAPKPGELVRLNPTLLS